MYLRGTPIWRPENSVNIWNLLWISRRLILSTAKTNLYSRSFPNALVSKRAQNQEISIYFSTNSIGALCHAPPKLGNSKCSGFKTKQAIALINCQQIWICPPLLPVEDKNSGRCLVLDFRMRWRHVKTIYRCIETDQWKMTKLREVLQPIPCRLYWPITFNGPF